MKEQPYAILKKITGMQSIVLTSRGNEAIKAALLLLKQSGAKKILIPDQGGWFAFKTMPEELGMEVEQVKTDYGIFLIEELKKKIAGNTALLYENPAGYFAEQPVEDIYSSCSKAGCPVVLDATGCIGKKDYSKFCDYMIGSFGDNKPVNLGYGGFIAAHKEIEVKPDFDASYAERLAAQLLKLGEAYSQYGKMRSKIISDLGAHDILHRDREGINVVVRYKDKAEKENLINYCRENSLEYRECPFYIRVKAKAISIEVKRVK